MNTVRGFALLILSVLPGLVVAQIDDDSWTLQPRLSIGKLLPGSDVREERRFWIQPATGQFMIYPEPSIRYEGTTLDLCVRAFPARPGWIALTVGGGVTWFYRSDRDAVVGAQATDKGVGVQLAPGDFVVFPLSAGVQVVYPGRSSTDFMLFAGVQGTANFVSGNIPMDQQVKGGFGFTAGFAAKVFELGLRYESFSDLRNLGVYLGFRLNPFELGGSTSEHDQGGRGGDIR